MDKNRILFFICLLTVLALPMLAQGGIVLTETPATPITSYAAVTVTVPAVIGIDIPSSVTFDLSSLPAQSAEPNCEVSNVFPLHPTCDVQVYYDYTAGSHGDWPANTSEIAVLLYSTDDVAHTLAARLDRFPDFGGFVLNPGVAENNSYTVGGADGTASEVILTSVDALLDVGTLPNAHRWTRADQKLQFVLPLGDEPVGSITHQVIFTFGR